VEDRGGGERDRYLLGDSGAELAHLVAQAEVYAEEARQLLDLIGVGPGAAAVDIGCGVLGICTCCANGPTPPGAWSAWTASRA
jgi:hypothetical protein